MAEFNWTVDDIKRAQRDFSNNFMRLDCIRKESYDVAIDCMTKCIEKKATDEVSNLKEIIKNIYIETTTDHYGNPINALTEIDKILDETRHLWDSK